MRSLRAYLGTGVVLLLSGLLLMLFYVPHPTSIPAMSGQSGVTVGGIFRGIHVWAAQLIVLAVLVYVACTVFVKTNHPRIGWAACLAVLTGLLWFTGILLPWDHLAYWTHVLILTVLLLTLLIFYVRRTRRNLSATL